MPNANRAGELPQGYLLAMKGNPEQREISEDEEMAGPGDSGEDTEKSRGCLDGRKWEGDEGGHFAPTRVLYGLLDENSKSESYT